MGDLSQMEKSHKTTLESGLEPPRTHTRRHHRRQGRPKGHEGHTTTKQQTTNKDEHAYLDEMLHYAHACVRGGGLGVEGSSPMTPRGEAPKNPAGTNALGPVGIPPKAKATALPLQNPAAAGLFFFVCRPAATSTVDVLPNPKQPASSMP